MVSEDDMDQCALKKERIEMFNGGHVNNLPDQLLHQILSFLPTRDAIATCILSKRWRYLWRFAYTLDFDFEQFTIGRKPIQSPPEHHLQRFYHFVDQTLMLYDNSAAIQNSRIHIDWNKFWQVDKNNNLRSRLDAWIDWAVTHHKVQVFHILLSAGTSGYFSFGEETESWYQLPECVFYSQSITSLQLNYCKFYDFGVVNLFSLKSLSLSSVCVKDKTMQLVVTSCPVLEILEMDNCLELASLGGNSTSIKSLKIKRCYHLEKLEMDAPNLKELKLGSNPKLRIKEWGTSQSLCSLQMIGLSWMFKPANGVNCTSLKTLSLICMKITEDIFQYLMFECHPLENLKLIYCDSFKDIKTLSERHKMLVVVESICMKVHPQNRVSFEIKEKQPLPRKGPQYYRKKYLNPLFL